MNVYYISPSTIPSRSANSIHVMNMCEGLLQLNCKVSLFAHSKLCCASDCREQLEEVYGMDIKKIKLNIFFSKKNKGIEFFIALYSFKCFMFDLVRNHKPGYIISRNLYAAVIFGLFFRRQVIYETHSQERGFRKNIQKLLLNSNKVKTIVISNALKKILCTSHNVCNKNINVFHDAARDGRLKLNYLQRQKLQNKFVKSNAGLYYPKYIGYFGHLYPGRGIEIIENLAKLNPSYGFIVYGGNEKEIKKYKKCNTNNNLFFMGYISPSFSYESMTMMDILLMPYQKNVSIGLKGVDTAKWMSPMKMFEYMSVGVPIISSDLPVLREVLVNNENSLLVEADNIKAWSRALNEVIYNEILAERLGSNAYDEYKNKYTWKLRAKGIIDLWSNNVD